MQKVSADINKINDLVKNIEGELKKIKDLLNEAGQLEQKQDYESMPGVEGYFDGENLVTSDGKKIDVPSNYAAKTRILHGDTLKLIEENGKKLYKQINKQKKQKITGILTKKEGKWYILSPEGSYKISDTAAEFNKAEINDEAIAIIPQNNTSVPFAALDKVKKAKDSNESTNQSKQQNPPREQNNKNTSAEAKEKPQAASKSNNQKEETPKQKPGNNDKQQNKPKEPKKDKKQNDQKQDSKKEQKPEPKQDSPEPKKQTSGEDSNKQEVSGTIDTSSKEIEEFDLR